jgi:hypothetical protein
MMIQFTTTILQFAKKGEKTGWSYIDINSAQANKLNPRCKVSYRVKGKIDNYTFEKIALLPMGDGHFILPINGVVRKAIQKYQGHTVKVVLELDKRPLALSRDLIKCLNEDPLAKAYFISLPKSHQNYFSNWIESAKTVQTKTKRIVMAMEAFSKKQGYGEMIRANKNNPR